MKTINLQDYYKDKALEKVKDGIQNLPIDESVKATLSSMIDLDMKNFEVLQEAVDLIRTYKNITDEIAKLIQKHNDTLYKDVAHFMKTINEILGSQGEQLSALRSRIYELENKCIFRN